MFQIFYTSFISDCDASKDDSGCCTDTLPCSMGQGDCDADSECFGNLVCGTDNCIIFTNAWPDTLFDCCTTGKSLYNFSLDM